MITDFIFKEQVKRLKGIWPQSFSEGKIKEIWFIIRDCDDSWLLNTIQEFILRGPTAPTPHDFYSLKKVYLRSLDTNLKQIEHNTTSVLNHEERAELFQILKKASTGTLPRDQAKQACDFYADVLTKRKVKVGNYKRLDLTETDFDKQWKNDRWDD